MKLWMKNTLLAILTLMIVVTPLIFNKDAEFAGADGMAEEAVNELASDYVPWYESFWEPPSGEVESLLFALQAAIGAGILGFGIGKFTSNKKKEQ